MAQVNYSPGSNEVQPDAAPPNDYQRVDATPAAFGGQLAQATEKAGAGALDLSKFWGKIQAQDAGNNAEKEASDLLVHAKSLEGQDALNSQSAILKQLDDIKAKYRGQLQSPEAQAQFDSSTTPFFNRFIRGNLDTHFVDQSKAVASKVNTDSFNNAINMAATAGSTGDWKSVGPARERAGLAMKIDAQQKGLWSTPEAQQAADEKANAAWSAAIEARALTNPDDAWNHLQQPEIKSALGKNFDAVYQKVQESVKRAYISKAEELEATNPPQAKPFVEANQAKFFDAYGEMLKQVSETHVRADAATRLDQIDKEIAASPPGGAVRSPSSYADPGLQPGYTYEKAAFGHESSGNATAVNNTPYTDERGVYHPQGTGASGLFQFIPSTAEGVRRAHPELNLPQGFERDGSPQGIANQRAAFAAFTADNRAALQSAGIEPNDKNAFMASFLGAGGATKFIKAAQADPTQSAAALFPAAAAANAKVFYAGGPGGSTPRTLGQVYALMTQKFSGNATVAAGETPQPVEGGLPKVESGPYEEPTAPSTPPRTPAALTFPAPSAPPTAPEISPEVQITLDAQKTYHDRLAAIEANDASDEVKAAMGDLAKRRYEMAMAEAGLVTQQREARERAVTDDVLGIAAKGDVNASFTRLKQYLDAHQIDFKAYDTISGVIAQRTGNPDPISVGPKFQEYFDRILAPDGDPSKIGGVMPLLEAEQRHELTGNGVKLLTEKLGLIKKSLNDYGFEKNNASFLAEMKDKFVRENAYPGDKTIDKKGQEKFDDALVVYNAQYDSWRKARDEGKGPESFPLWDRKNFNAFMESQYSQRERERDRQADVEQQAGMTAPEGVDRTAFARIVQGAPKDVEPAHFAQDIAALNANPSPLMKSYFQAHYPKINPDELLANIQISPKAGGREPGYAKPAAAPQPSAPNVPPEQAFQGHLVVGSPAKFEAFGPKTGAVLPPEYPSATYQHQHPGQTNTVHPEDLLSTETRRAVAAEVQKRRKAKDEEDEQFRRAMKGEK